LVKIILFYYNQMVAATDLFESQNPVLRAVKKGEVGAADKAAIQLVKVQPYSRLAGLVSDT